MQRKTIWMNYLLIGISVLFLATGCGKETTESIHIVSYSYKNSSGVDLVMEVYNINGEKFRSFDIPDNESVITNTSREEGPVVFYFDTFSEMIGDSVVIRFNDNKCLYYSKDTSGELFDVTKYDNYSEELIKMKEYTLSFIFTLDDYSESSSCTGTP
ncbi:MAG: hypothetical protein GY816_15820 [Cytophagales bacterium]|nr:hypothetical protein [Cytophagales bacterium]